MFLHEGTNILINSIDAVGNVTNLQTISNVQIPVHYITTIPTKLTGKYIATTTCILEVVIDEIINIQTLNLLCYQWFL